MRLGFRNKTAYLIVIFVYTYLYKNILSSIYINSSEFNASHPPGAGARGNNALSIFRERYNLTVAALREKKFARTRLALAGALAAALADQPLTDISVKALCQAAEVSEATFFNYFPSKSDLMSYLAHLWLLELGWHIQAAAEKQRGLTVIDALFAHAAATCLRKPGVFRELLVWIARGGNLDPALTISAIEKQLAFPELANIEQLPLKGIDAWLVAEVQAAVAGGALPTNTLLPTLLAGLLSILLGVPMTLLASDPTRVGPMYRQQLALLWAGVRASAGQRS